MTITVSVDVGYVDVEVAISDFDDDDLIEEIESRGYTVLDAICEPFTSEELETMQTLIDGQNPKIGSVLYNIREKITRQ